MISSVAGDIYSGKMDARLRRKRNEGEDDRRVEVAKLVRQQESQLQDKIGELSVEMR